MWINKTDFHNLQAKVSHLIYSLIAGYKTGTNEFGVINHISGDPKWIDKKDFEELTKKVNIVNAQLTNQINDIMKYLNIGYSQPQSRKLIKKKK